MITADQLVAHAIGDYVLQSDWMANKKRSENVAAAVHALVYTLCFLPFVWSDRPAYRAFDVLAVIGFTHFLIDRFGLARYVVWAKNFLAPRWMLLGEMPAEATLADGSVWRARREWMVRNLPWSSCQGTGYPPDRPPFLAVWLLIVADNILHVVINALALRFL
jgi:hypothetical protein